MEDSLEIRLNNGDYTATRYNTTLFTHLGELAIFDHVFLELEKQDEVTQGAYVFSDHEYYVTLATFAIDNAFPMVLNKTEVAECDQLAWANAQLGDLNNTDTYPEEWDDGTS